MWKDGEVDDDAVRGQLIMYCGVMFGVSGAAAGVRILSSQIAKTTLKKLPQKALTKTLWYPVVKQVGKLIGIKVTKNTVARGISKAIPVVGGVISGSLNFASMLPMAKRLAAALDKANFDYAEEEIMADYWEIQEMDNVNRQSTGEEKTAAINRTVKVFNKVGAGISSALSKTKKNKSAALTDSPHEPEDEIFSKIEKLAKLREAEVVTQEEFDKKKAELLSQI